MSAPPATTEVPIALFRSKTANAPRRKSLAWDTLRAALTQHEVRPEKDGPLWSPTAYREKASRGKEGVAEVSCFVADYDDGITPEQLATLWEPYEYVLHSTHSHTAAAPRWRVVFPLKELVPAAEWPRVYRRLAYHLGGGHTDPSCKDCSRIYYLPSCPPGVETFALHHPGRWLDPYSFVDPPEEPRPKREAAPRDDEGRPTADLLLSRALERSEGRNNGALWLACQLRDNGYSEGEAAGVLESYTSSVPSVNGKGDHFTDAEALDVLRKAYQRPARAPWERRNGRWEPPPEEVIRCEEVSPPPEEPAGEVSAAILAEIEDQGGGKKGEQQPSELVLARRFAREVKSRFAFFEGAQWWEYGGGRWSYSSCEVAEAEVQRFMERLRFNGVDVAVTATKVSSVLKLARPHLGVHQIRELNARPTLVPLSNGVYDTEADKLLPHSPDHFLTNQLPFDYDPAAECPRWKQFLAEVMLTTERHPCDEWIEVMQEWFGYSLVPDNSAQVSMVWVGEGRNGKGVAARCLEALLGPTQCCAVPVEQLHDPYHRAELQGKLVGFVNEPDARAMVKNGTHFKAITGGDTISARRPTEKVFSFVPFCRLVISTNSIPSTKDLSHGYFRRLLIIEWRRQFSADDADPHLDSKLRQELPGIFNWALEGLRRFRERGSKFAELPESNRLLADYRTSEDPLRQFIDEECEVRADHRAEVGKLWKAYREWCAETGYREVGTAVKMGRRLQQMGYEVEVGKDEDRNSVRLRKGLRLRKEEEPERAGDLGFDEE